MIFWQLPLFVFSLLIAFPQASSALILRVLCPFAVVSRALSAFFPQRAYNSLYYLRLTEDRLVITFVSFLEFSPFVPWLSVRFFLTPHLFV